MLGLLAASDRDSNGESFFDGAVSLIVGASTWTLHQLIDWDYVTHKLKGLYQREQAHCGGLKHNTLLSMFTRVSE